LEIQRYIIPGGAYARQAFAQRAAIGSARGTAASNACV
jgi:hypothetical protein